MSDATNNPYTGAIAVVFFIAAHFINMKWGRGTRVAYAALVWGIIASFLLYSSTWATWIASRISGFVDGFFGMPAHILMGVVFALAVIATVADVMHDPDYNSAALWALIIGPIFAHGASGFLHVIGEILYGGMTIVAQDIVAWLLGRW